MLHSIVMSVFLVFVIHQLLIFFQNTLTVRKEKDYLFSPKEKYEQINKVIQNTTNIVKDDFDMKNELKEYMKNYLKTT